MNWTNWHSGVASTLVFLGGCTLIVGLDKEYVLDPAALEVVEGGGDEGAGEGNPVMSCVQASDCPEPADKRCGTATCEGGMQHGVRLQERCLRSRDVQRSHMR